MNVPDVSLTQPWIDAIDGWVLQMTCGLDRRGDLTAAGVIARAATGPPAALPA